MFGHLFSKARGKFAQEPWMLALWFAALALALRATVDHGFVTLYTGDNGEELTLGAARNFQKFGFAALKFLPVHDEIRGELSEFPRYYTHSPPLPPLLVGATYVASGGSIFFSRLVVILITLAGFFFAVRAAQELAKALLPEMGSAPAVAGTVMACLLSTSAGVLCYGDALSEVPLQETLQWATLLTFARFLLAPSIRGMRTLAALGALTVWTGLDWNLPLGLILGYCVVTKTSTSNERWRALGLVIGLGIALPVLLRLLQNSWALGGIDHALRDFYGRARFRAGLGQRYPYSFWTHLARFSVAMVWLSGLAAPLLIWFNRRLPLSSETRNPQIVTLFWLWGIGSVSWQFLMPQAAMFHAYTVLHPANFVLLWGALSAARLWPSRPGLVASLVSLQLLCGGAIFATEIGIPFLRDSSAKLARELCESDRAALRIRIPDMSSSVSKMIGVQLDASRGSTTCGARSAAAKAVLRGYLGLIRISSLQ